MNYNTEGSMSQSTQPPQPHMQIFREGIKLDEALDKLDMLINKISSNDAASVPECPERNVVEVSLHEFLHGEAGLQEGRCERLYRLVQALHALLFE